MRLRWRRMALAPLLLALAVAAPAEEELPTLPEPVGPEDLERLAQLDEDRRARGRLYPVSPRVSRYLAAAAEETDAANTDEAMLLLTKLKPKRLNPYERALVYRLQGFVAYSAGDAQGAIDAFHKVLAEEILPLKDDVRLRFNIAQLNAGLQNWPDTIRALHDWFGYVQDSNPLAYYLLAIAHFQQDQIDKAIPNAERAVDLAPEPKEGWLQLLAALYIQTGNYADATPVLEELVVRFPKKLYWVQLTLIYGARENYRSSLAVQQVAYQQGLLTEDKELRRLARGYLYADLPHPASEVLAKGMDDGLIERDAEAYELLANSRIAAREYDAALPPLAKAAELADDGELYVRLGQVRLQREEWSEAASMFQKALDRGGLEKPGNALLLLGIASYNDGRTGPARSYFVRARKHEASRPQAEKWLKHIENETRSQEEAADAREDTDSPSA
jgi:tetratricopeptide (TPR) repeat protein